MTPIGYTVKAMTTEDNIGAEVTRLSRWRRRILVIIAVGYVVWWAGFLGATSGVAEMVKGGDAIAAILTIVGFVMWAVPLTLLLTAGRRMALRLRPSVRAALEDELTKSNRRVAFQTGYWALLGVICVLFAVSQFNPASLNVALPVLIAVGVSVPLLRFAVLEQHGDING